MRCFDFFVKKMVKAGRSFESLYNRRKGVCKGNYSWETQRRCPARDIGGASD